MHLNHDNQRPEWARGPDAHAERLRQANLRQGIPAWALNRNGRLSHPKMITVCLAMGAWAAYTLWQLVDALIPTH